MSYTHITSKQRNELSILLQAGTNIKDIASLLGKVESSIYREIKRNRENEKYHARIAEQKAKERRIQANQRFRRIENNEWLEQYIKKKLRIYWSPEQIAGRLKNKYGKVVVCHETIYQHIYKVNPGLKQYLRCQKGKYRKRYGTKIYEIRREEAKKKRINQRPAIVDKRARIGDWEGDTIVGLGRKQRILTHVERRSGYLLADKLDQTSKEIIRDKAYRSFKRIAQSKKHTITYDNGKEFEDHELIERDNKVDVYFAYPYHSWERGTNENTNGLLRFFFPKKTSLANIVQEDVKKAVRLINHRPRKRLNYLTPYEMFNGKVAL